MNYASIHLADCANGEGMRVSLFVSGCTQHCPGCFNSEAWDFDYGWVYNEATEQFLMTCIDKPYIDGLTILGGEPLHPLNQSGIIELVQKVKDLGKTVWIYTGYTWEELSNRFPRAILQNTDVLVDGPFVLEEKDITLQFRGSRNQRVIDVQKSLKEGRVVLYELPKRPVLE